MTHTVQLPRLAGWAGDVVLRAEARLQPGDADRYAVETGITWFGGEPYCPDLYALARGLGDAKIADIVHTMLNPRSRYAQVTRKQIRVVADALLTRYSTARAVYAAALGVTEDQLVQAGQAFGE